MHHHHQTLPFKTALMQGFSVVVVLLLAGFSLAGQKTLPDVSLPFNFYTATTNDAGIAFYRKQDHTSYLISPYNDYLSSNGIRLALLPQSEKSYASISRPQKNFPFNIVNQALSYVGNGQLLYSYKGNEASASYIGIIKDNTFTVTRTVTFPMSKIPGFIPLVPNQLGMTILYSRDDVIADQNGVLMTESSDTDVETLTQETGKAISRVKLEKRQVERSGNTIVIMNPRAAGIILVTVPNANHIVVDNEAKLIEFVEDVPSEETYTVATTMTIQVHESNL